MKTKAELRVSFIVIIVTVLVGFLTLTTVGRLNTGLGFGHDVRLIVETKDRTGLNNFLSNQTRNNREWRKRVIDSNHYALSFSGVENITDLVNSIDAHVSDLVVWNTGTFGSVTKLISTQSFISLYLVLFMALTAGYFCFRFRFFGWIAGMEIVIGVMLSLLLVSLFGYPFTKSLWYSVLISFMMLVYQKQMYLVDSEGLTLHEVVESRQDIRKRHIRVSLLHSAFYLIFGFVAVVLNRYGLVRTGWYMIFLGYIVLIQFLLFNFVFERILLKIPKESSFVQFQNINILKITQPTHILFKNTVSVMLAVLLLSTLFAIPKGIDLHKGWDFANQNVLIMNDARSTAYLELQATLYEVGIFDNQLSYEVTEQGDTWIHFDENVTSKQLGAAARGVKTKFNVKGTYYDTHENLFPLEDVDFYLTLGVFILASWIMVSCIFGFKRSILIPILSVLSSMLFVFLTMIYHIKWSRETVYIVWTIPLIIGCYYSSQYSLNRFFNLDLFELEFMDSLMLNVILFAIISTPILIIIPVPITVEMIAILMMMIFSIYLALIILYCIAWLIRRWVQKRERYV